MSYRLAWVGGRLVKMLTPWFQCFCLTVGMLMLAPQSVRADATLVFNDPLMPWFEAIDQPGAGQMQHGKNLLLSRPFLTRIPDDSVIVTDRVPTAVPGAGRYRFVATRDESGSYAMVYAPIGRKFKVWMDKITGGTVKAWWFNPRTGEATAIGEFPNTGEREFISPNPGEALDWVLVLDDAGKNFSPPGTSVDAKK